MKVVKTLSCLSVRGMGEKLTSGRRKNGSQSAMRKSESGVAGRRITNTKRKSFKDKPRLGNVETIFPRAQSRRLFGRFQLRGVASLLFRLVGNL